ncbi:MAG: tryptophan--tRNA ligase [Halobacteriota archaeon]
MTRDSDPDGWRTATETRDPLERSRWRVSGSSTDRGGVADDASNTVLPDGGATDTEEVALDPWGSSTVADYRKLFETFGIEEFDEVLPEVPDPHYLMRRGVIFGHRDYRPVARAMREGDPFAALSGFMPTGDPHIGHKMVFDELIWHQRQGADTYALIADLEAHAARGLTWDEIDEHARDYILSLLALGFDPEAGTLYRQSQNREVQDLAFELGAKANFSELQAIYGFDGETDVSHMQSVVTQMADILYPQLDEPKPTVIPVGPDQDPHVRLARDLAARMRYFKITEAYLSQELGDDERRIASWLDDEIRRAFLHTVEATPGADVSGGELEFANCEQAALVLRGLREYLLEDGASPPEVGDFDLDAILYVEHDYSQDDWIQALSDLADAVREPRSPFGAHTLDSLVDRLSDAGREPFRRRTRFFDRNAVDGAFDALRDALDAADRNIRTYEAHIDVFDMSPSEADELAREVEVEHGGYGFLPPSSIYHRFMTGLTGGKMSSSIPASHISLLDDPEEGYDKVRSATTGGRETAELQRELGGEADKCPVYELYAYLLSGDDDEFAKLVYDECVGGERLCGDCKEQAAQLMKAFLEDHQEKRAEAEALLDDLDMGFDSARRG